MSENNAESESPRETVVNAEAEQEKGNKKPILSCCWRCLSRFADNFPRASTVLFRILIPLWILIIIATVCGYYLANFEAPDEFDRNDSILAKRFAAELFPLNETLDSLFSLPIRCWESYLNKTDEPAFKNTSDYALDQFNSSDEDLYITDYITDHMKECGKKAQGIVLILLDGSKKIALLAATEKMTFNWIRCWNESLTGDFGTHIPTPEQIEAAANQPDFYEMIWRLDRAHKYEIYLEELGDDSPRNTLKALDWSIRNATGRYNCTSNTSGTAWFWFTVMTTVGYGNQSPVTFSGRFMVGMLGIPSILAFGVVLASAGGVVKIIFNDLVFRLRFGLMNLDQRWINGRFGLSHLHKKSWGKVLNPVLGSLWWGTWSIAWMALLARESYRWWVDRLVAYTDLTKAESMWFAYISSTTVGLGDFFLPPEVMFTGDVFRFSFLFLTGFVLFSTFANSFGVLILAVLPKGKSLEDRVKRTNLLIGGNQTSEEEEDDENDESNSKTVKILEELVANSDERSDVRRTTRGLSLLLKEEELLRELLARTREETMTIVKDRVTSKNNGDHPKVRTLSAALKEKELLKELLERTITERLQIEKYSCATRGLEPFQISEASSSSRTLSA